MTVNLVHLLLSVCSWYYTTPPVGDNDPCKLMHYYSAWVRLAKIYTFIQYWLTSQEYHVKINNSIVTSHNKSKITWEGFGVFLFFSIDLREWKVKVEMLKVTNQEKQGKSNK